MYVDPKLAIEFCIVMIYCIYLVFQTKRLDYILIN